MQVDSKVDSIIAVKGTKARISIDRSPAGPTYVDIKCVLQGTDQWKISEYLEAVEMRSRIQ